MVYLPIPWSERNYRGQTNQGTSACEVAALFAPAQLTNQTCAGRHFGLGRTKYTSNKSDTCRPLFQFRNNKVDC
jgi:hypothetical protein